MRNCSLCRIPDRPQFTQESCNCGEKGDVLGKHTADCRSIEHLVKKDIRFVKPDFIMTRAMEEKGWRVRGLFQGKMAIERFLCTPCIRSQSEIADIEAYRKKIALEAEGNPAMSLYEVLCS